MTLRSTQKHKARWRQQRNSFVRFERLEERRLLAVDLGLLADVNTASTSFRSSDPANFADIGSFALFSAYRDSYGAELWRTDGTEAGTFLVAETEAGYISGFPSPLGRIGNIAFFSAYSGDYGAELYKTDGTKQGTTLVKDIVPGLGNSVPQPLGAVGDSLLFWAQDANGQYNLWVTDGSSVGTEQLAAIQPGNSNAVVVDGFAYFSADDGISGVELWRSDGTVNGTSLVKEIAAGSLGSSITSISAIGTKIIFGAGDSPENVELWESDGTSGGTQLLREIVAGPFGSNPQQLTLSSQGVFFVAEGGLWLTNGTTSGTQLVSPLPPNTIEILGVIGDQAILAINNFALWQSDGTSVGTQLIDDGGLGVSEIFSRNYSFVGSDFYFTAASTTEGDELWKFSGGIVSLVSDIFVGPNGAFPSALGSFGNKLLFSADDGSSGIEPWITNGTPAGTRQIRDIATGTDDGALELLAAVGDSLIYIGRQPDTGWELYRTNGTAAGTRLLKDINPGPVSSNPDGAFLDGTTLYFSADGGQGVELWKTDGTESGTQLVADINSGVLSSFPTDLTRLGSNILFSAVGSTGRELWKLDAATQTATQLLDNNGQVVSEPSNFTHFGSKLIFTATTVSNGNELWVTDGTQAGTKLLLDLVSGPADSNISDLTPLGNKIIFSAIEPSFGREVWVTDGTAAGTEMLLDIVPGLEGSFTAELKAFGDRVYFRADDQSNGFELWSTDGTTSGTGMVADINSGALGSFPRDFVTLNNQLLFTADTDDLGSELWRYDGTSLSLVRDIRQGLAESAITPLATIDNRYYFEANDGVHGPEVWVSDGTASGTLLLDDITGDSGGSFISDIAKLGPKLIVAGYTDAVGLELWIEKNLPPEQLALSKASVSENEAVGTLVGSVSAFDPNEWDSLTYALVAGAGSDDNSLFDLVGVNLRTKVAFNFEQQSTRTIRLRATDSEGNQVEASFTINVLNVAESPLELQLNDNLVFENSPIGSVVGLLSTIDPDGPGSFEYSLVNGPGSTDNSSFEIVGVELRTKQTFNFEVKRTFNVRVQTRDGDGLTLQRSLSVEVEDLNEPSVSVQLSNQSLSENTPAGTVVGSLTTTDPDAADAFVYTLVSGVGDSDNSLFEIVGNSLRSKQTFDFETKSNYSIRVQSTDLASHALSTTFAISIVDVSEFAPEDTSRNGTITPFDALLVINYLNSGEDRAVNDANRHLNVIKDSRITPADALQVINILNARSSGEGETSSSLTQSTYHESTNDAFFADYESDLFYARRRNSANRFLGQ